ncbi:hypothetical protein ACLRGI_19090 [Paenarthrobacter nitroguajacolicus]|uniref:hypothetical protein n=1 Tax=Paenarthrobacter nitroguajacolicus TaxID=211146 RepID=UPI003AE92A8E
MQSKVIYDGEIAITSNFPGADDWIHAHLPTEVSQMNGTGWRGHLQILNSAAQFDQLQRIADNSSSKRHPRLYMDETYEHILLGGQHLFLMRPGAAQSLPHAVFGSYDTDWKIVVPDASVASVRQTLRSLRSVLRGYHLDRRGLLMHGATAGGALFLGPSGAGKTSAAIRFARLANKPLVSTDRTVLRAGPTGGEVIAIGGPEVMRLGVGLARELDDALLTQGSTTRSHQDLKLVQVSGQVFGSKDKLELTFDDARSSLDIRSQDSTVLSAIVLPRVAESGGAVMRSEDEESVIEVTRHLLHPDARHGYPIASSMLASDEAKSFAVELLANLPIYRLTWPLDDSDVRRKLFTELDEALAYA